jgi:hypothetical protein
MALAMLNQESVERRKDTLKNNDVLWEDLTLAQKFAASSLTQFGYELSFIRDHYCTHVAILICNENIATISKAGEINTHPTVKIRT